VTCYVSLTDTVIITSTLQKINNINIESILVSV